MPIIKYLLVHVVQALNYLHDENITWGDALQQNIVVTSDFGIKIIDVGDDHDKAYDIKMLLGLMYNLISGDAEFVKKDLDWLLPRFKAFENTGQHPLYVKMALQLFESQSVAEMMFADFWQSCEGQTPPICMTQAMPDLKELKMAAWFGMREEGRECLRGLGVDAESSTTAR